MAGLTVGAVTAMATAISPAEAASFEIVGGAADLLRAGPGGNDLLPALYDSDSRGGYLGATIQVTEPASITVTFLGFEALYKNSFQVNGTTLFDTDSFHPDYFVTDIMDVSDAIDVVAGAIPFQFDVGNIGSVSNGGNAAAAPIDFFVSVDEDALARGGQSLVLFLDDGGNGPDADYDDMAIRLEIAESSAGVTEASTPSAFGLFLSTLALVGIIGWRRRDGLIPRTASVS